MDKQTALNAMQKLTELHQLINKYKQQIRNQHAGTMQGAQELIDEMKGAHGGSKMTLNDAIYLKARALALADPACPDIHWSK